MTTPWRRYLAVAVVAAGAQLLLPVGTLRDVLYHLAAVAGLIAIVTGIRRNRPSRRFAWYLLAAGNAAWVLGDALWTWADDVESIAPFPTLAEIPDVAGYPLLLTGLYVLVRSRGPERRPTAWVDSAILTVGLALVTVVFVIEPTWADAARTVPERTFGITSAVGGVLLAGMLARLATAPGAWSAGARLLVSSLALTLLADSLAQVSTFVPAIAAREELLDPLWLLAYALCGAAALHPSMSELSAAEPAGSESMRTNRLVALAAAASAGPIIIVGELLVGHPLSAWEVISATAVLALLVLVRMIRMVRQLQDQADRLGQLADTDYVTGLANRRRFTDRLAALLDDPGEVAALLLIDVERFAEISDTLGHRTGDAILHAVGARLSEVTGPHALVARMGDNAFGVLEPWVGPVAPSDEVAARIRAALEEPLDLAGLVVSVEVSIGALALPADGAEPGLALHRADVALSAAKVQPGRTARYGAEMETGGTLAPLLIGELRGALDHHDIVLHYQPQIDLTTGHVFGVEALARWQHPRHGLLGPDSFIAAAERTGLIGPLTHFVLDHALAQCARWRRAGIHLTVAVNLSVLNLLDPGLVDDVVATLARHGLDPTALELEITEGSAMVDPRRSLQVLGALADLGITLSIDDYGTGHSSLTYLQRLPVRRLKIDRSFVARINTDTASAAIVASTIELARHLHLDVIAEGVEDDTTLLALRDLHCFGAQGFGFGRPVPATQLPALIERIHHRLPTLLRTSNRRMTSVR